MIKSRSVFPLFTVIGLMNVPLPFENTSLAVAQQPSYAFRSSATGSNTEMPSSDIARSAFLAAKKADWAQVHNLTQGMSQNGLYYLLTWMELKDPKNTIPVSDISAFLSQYAGWPSLSNIRETVEASCIRQMTSETLVQWFLENPPQTIEGEMAYSKALIETGKIKEGVEGLKALWYSASLSAGQEQRFLDMFSAYLTPDDMTHRLDEMLWANKTTDAKRLINRVSPDVAQSAQLRMRLMSVDKTLGDVGLNSNTAERSQAGLLHAQVYYLRKTNQDVEAINLLKQIPLDIKQIHAPEWWQHQSALARTALKLQGPESAYTLVSQNGLYKGSDFVDAQWLSGWIALRFMNNPKQAQQHFLAMVQEVNMPISQSRAFYWLGRSYAADGQDEQAKLAYQKASEFIYTYYGQLAASELGQTTAIMPPSQVQPHEINDGEGVKKTIASATFDGNDFDNLPIIQAIKAASAVGAVEEERQLLFSFAKNTRIPEHHRRLANYIAGRSQGDLLVKLGKAALSNGVMVTNNLYPKLNWFLSGAPHSSVELALVKSVSRQESEFDPYVSSPVGAKGLMQMMPATAVQVMKEMGLSGDPLKILNQPERNIEMGSTYLYNLIDQYRGSYILALAAYNAGGTRVNRWINDYGDPRDSRTDVIDWVELIPFNETRNYVQRIMESLIVYRSLLNKQSLQLTLTADLKRGK